MNKKFNNFEDLDFLKNQNLKLKALTKKSIEEMNSILLLGHEGSGRLTRARILLSEFFGNKIELSKKEIILEGKEKNFFYFERSSYHLEIDMKMCTHINENNLYEFFLKDFVKTKNVMTNKPNVIIFKHSELFSNKFESILSILIDKYYLSCKLIFISTRNFNKLLNSRVFKLKFNNIKKEFIKDYLMNYSQEKKIIIKENDIIEIIDTIHKNELCYNLNDIFYLFDISTFQGHYEKFYDSYNIFIDNILDIIFSDNFIYNDLIKIRYYIYDLYTINYDSIKIIKYVTDYILNKFNKNQKLIFDFIKLTNNINKSLLKCNKEAIHLEKFFLGILKLKYKYLIKKSLKDICYIK